MEETVVYTLSNRLGGRSEVLQTPMFEVLGHLITHFEEEQRQVDQEQMKYYMDFIAMLNSNPQNEKQAKQTEKFRKQIEPKLSDPNKSNQSGEDIKNKYQWNERVQKKIAEKQAKERLKNKT